VRALPLPYPPLADRLTGIVLRPWGDDGDAEALAAAWADAEVAARTQVPADTSVAAARTWIVGEPERRSRGLALDLVVSRGEDATAVLGEVGLAHLDRAGRAEVGFWLAPDARGKGLATAAVRVVTVWALHAAGADRSRGLALRQLWARTAPGDHRAAGVLGRTGYRLRGQAAGSAIWAIGAANLRA